MKRRILLVEDDVQIAAALREVLESEGCAVLHATRGLTLREKRHHFGLHPAQEAGRQTPDV
jgi:DNA-binding response OmpR family regulator